MSKRILIVGGGPGGYVSAIRATQLGAQVTLIEKDSLGGTCLNKGCIPTKALLETADIYKKIKEADTFGIRAEKVSLDYLAASRRKDTIVKQVVSGVNYLMKKNDIKVIKGTATLIDNNTVQMQEDSSKINADNIIIATGSKPSTVPIDGVDSPGVINSDQALIMDTLPKSIIVVGGGVIGLEFAQIFHRMGSIVTVVEMMPQLLPYEDTEVADILEETLNKEGIDTFTSASVSSINHNQDGEVVVFDTKDGRQERLTEKVLLAVGRRPNADDLGVEKLGLAMDKDKIITDNKMQTNIPGIYAIGDVIGGLMLAHVAMEEGKCAVENIMGQKREMRYQEVPRCVYTSPSLGSVGLTENQAKEKYENVKVGKFPFRANSKAMIMNETSGIVKFIVDASCGEILGAQVLGPHATEVIAEIVIAMKLEATVGDIASTIHAHPTISEAVSEAALDVNGCCIHM